MLRLTSACAAAFFALCATALASEPAHAPELDDMIARQAKRHGVPEKLVRRIVMRESRYNPKARNHSFWGLMQISYPTARSMGFKGSRSQLLDPVVNLTYAVPYLANAFIIAGKQEDAAVRLYASGYYTTAKNRNLIGQLRTADSTPLVPDEGFLTATARPVSNLITAVVGGPAAQPPQVAEAAASAPAETGGKSNGPEVAMVSGKKGYTPPPKWIKDGGVSLVARGEQRIEQVAAYSPASNSGTAPRRSAARGKNQKNTEFASLDAPPSSAQAYAPAASAAEGGPQAAIAQATGAPVTAPPDDGTGPAKAPAKKAKASTAGRSRKTAVETAAAIDDAAAPVAPAADAAQVPAKKQVGKVRIASKKPSRAVAIAAKADTSPTPVAQ